MYSLAEDLAIPDPLGEVDVAVLVGVRHAQDPLDHDVLTLHRALQDGI